MIPSAQPSRPEPELGCHPEPPRGRADGSPVIPPRRALCILFPFHGLHPGLRHPSALPPSRPSQAIPPGTAMLALPSEAPRCLSAAAGVKALLCLSPCPHLLRQSPCSLTPRPGVLKLAWRACQTHGPGTPTPEILIQQVWSGAREFAFLVRSQALLVHGPHFEWRCS